MENKSAFAEIIESSLNIFKAQTWQWDNIPKYANLVKIKDKNRIIFGLIHNIQTGSLDPNRTVVAYQKTHQELLRDQPQIFEFLQTTFSCITLGYLQDNKIIYQLAPEPPKIHAFVSLASDEEIKSFFSNEQYLHVLFCFSNLLFSMDELLLSLLKNLSDLNALSEENVVKFIETFSILTGNDYRRLKIFLQRAQNIIKIAQ